MFQNDKYITRGIIEKINTINPVIYLLLWQLIDEMKVDKKDYLQIFNLRAKFGKRAVQEIEHMQEEPEYSSIHRFYTEMPLVNAKIYIIDDGHHSTMLLAEEY